MKFYLKSIREAHTNFCTCVCYLTESQVLTCGDDHKLNWWNILNFSLIKTFQLPDDFYVTNLEVFKSILKSNNFNRETSAQQNQLKVILANTDGKFHFSNVTLEKIEKSIEAHQGAITSLKISKDESAILSAGEDGFIKIWSKTGLLRNTIIIETNTIHCALWAEDIFEQILYSTKDIISIRPLAPNSKVLSWIAHKGFIIRCIDWNPKFKLILSSDEVGSIKLWDSQGNLIRKIDNLENLIPSCLSWNKNGDKFVCGGYNFLQLSDKKGFVLSIQRLNETQKDQKPTKSLKNQASQSLLKIDWSVYSNSISAVSSAGYLFHGALINDVVQWLSYYLFIINSKKVLLKNILIDFEEELEFNEPILKYSMQFGYLILLFFNQCVIYALTDLTLTEFEQKKIVLTNVIIPLKEFSYFLILQSQTQFSLINQSSINLFNYQGRQISSMKISNNNKLQEEINDCTISLSEDCLAFRDPFETKVIRFYDTSKGLEIFQNFDNKNKSLLNRKEFIHDHEVIKIKLNTNICSSKERKCAFIDKNLNLFITLVHSSTFTLISTVKLINICNDIMWNEKYDILAAIEQNTKLNVFIYPQSVYLDEDLLKISTLFIDYDIQNNNTNLNLNLSLISFQNVHIKLSGENGNIITKILNPLFILLHDYFSNDKLNLALKLCLLNLNKTNSIYNNNLNQKSNTELILWAAFTAMSLNKRNLDFAEQGYSAVEIFDRVLYIKKIKNVYESIKNNLESNKQLSNVIISETIKNSEIALLCGGNYLEAETLLFKSGLIVRCLFMHLDFFHWIEAIKIAKKYDKICSKDIIEFLNNDGINEEFEENILSQIVLTQRKEFLKKFQIKENNQIFNELENLDILSLEIIEKIKLNQFNFVINKK